MKIKGTSYTVDVLISVTFSYLSLPSEHSPSYRPQMRGGLVSYDSRATDAEVKDSGIQFVINLYSLKHPSALEKPQQLFISDFCCSIPLLLKYDNPILLYFG